MSSRLFIGAKAKKKDFQKDYLKLVLEQATEDSYTRRV